MAPTHQSHIENYRNWSGRTQQVIFMLQQEQKSHIMGIQDDPKHNLNGYTFGYINETGERESFNYYFPQATTNFLLGLNLKF